MIRASGVAFEGRIKILDGLSDCGCNVYFDVVDLVSLDVEESAGAAFVDLVLAIFTAGNGAEMSVVEN